MRYRSRAAMTAALEAAVPDPGFRATEPPPCDCNECDEIARSFEGRRWHEDPALLFRDNAALSLMSDEALAYFLPGLLTMLLHDADYEGRGTDTADALTGEGHTRAGAVERMTGAQRAAVYEVLAWWVEMEDVADVEAARQLSLAGHVAFTSEGLRELRKLYPEC